MALTIQLFQTGAAAIPALTAIATQRPNMKYSHELARDVKGRELAAEGVIDILRKITKDETIDALSRVMAHALACELNAILKIVDALERDPTHSARMLLDGPLA